MEFCCLRFKGVVAAPRTMGINARIVKVLGTEMYYKLNDGQSYKFWLTTGYELGSPATKVLINFCPFCGTNLHSYYNSDKYINEDVNVLLS